MSATVLSCTGSVVFSLELRSFLVISPTGLSSGLSRLLNALIRKVRTSSAMCTMLAGLLTCLCLGRFVIKPSIKHISGSRL